MTLTFAPIAADDPRIGAVVANLRQRQRRELVLSGDYADWRDIGAQFMRLQRPDAPAYRLWLVEEDGAPVAVVSIVFCSESAVVAGLLATRAWEAGVPPFFCRWLRREVLAWLDATHVRQTSVWVYSPKNDPPDVAWLARLGFVVHEEPPDASPAIVETLLTRRRPVAPA